MIVIGQSLNIHIGQAEGSCGHLIGHNEGTINQNNGKNHETN